MRLWQSVHLDPPERQRKRWTRVCVCVCVCHGKEKWVPTQTELCWQSPLWCPFLTSLWGCTESPCFSRISAPLQRGPREDLDSWNVWQTTATQTKGECPTRTLWSHKLLRPLMLASDWWGLNSHNWCSLLMSQLLFCSRSECLHLAFMKGTYEVTVTAHT